MNLKLMRIHNRLHVNFKCTPKLKRNKENVSLIHKETLYTGVFRRVMAFQLQVSLISKLNTYHGMKNYRYMS